MFKERHDSGIKAPPPSERAAKDDDLDLGHLARFRLFQNGENLFREGDRGGEAFVIKTGKVKVFTEDIGTLGVLGAGEMVGEMAIISDSDRVATAVAEEETLCVALSRKAMLYMLNTVDIETRTIIEFLVDHIGERLEGTTTAEDDDNAQRTHRILELLLENPDTKTKLALQEPFFRLLCTCLLTRASAS